MNRNTIKVPTHRVIYYSKTIILTLSLLVSFTSVYAQDCVNFSGQNIQQVSYEDQDGKTFVLSRFDRDEMVLQYSRSGQIRFTSYCCSEHPFRHDKALCSTTERGRYVLGIDHISTCTTLNSQNVFKVYTVITLHDGPEDIDFIARINGINHERIANCND